MLRLFFPSLALFGATLIVGCTVIQPPITYSLDEFIDVMSTGDEIDLASIQLDLTESQLSIKTVSELSTFGRQVERLLEQPIRLGSLGSAILDRLEYSYAGHLAMHHFYEHFEHAHADVHKAELDRIVDYMTATGDGSLEMPYRTLIPGDALLYVQQSGHRVIGFIYVKTNVEPMLLRVMRHREGHPFDDVYFDLSALYPALISELDTTANGNDSDTWTELLKNLAISGDSAAQLSLGQIFARSEEIPQAERLYMSASQTDNGYAHMLYGDLFAAGALQTREQNRDRFLQVAQSHYAQAIDYGFHTALRQQGMLLHQGLFGEQMRPRGWEMLERAAALDDTLALRYLAEAFRFGGQGVTVDYVRSAELYQRAAQLGDRRARVDYYRLLAFPDADMEVTEQAIDWLKESADSGDVLAMLELGNCNIRGCPTRPNFRRAQRWYREAVSVEPENPEVVNTIAWTLTVTDKKRLRAPDYALEIVEHLMATDAGSRADPMIVDTWAAVHAALGNFERAIELQREALDLARRERRSPDLINEIQNHLDSFLQGEALSERVP